jgi:hypothetical protein
VSYWDLVPLHFPSEKPPCPCHLSEGHLALAQSRTLALTIGPFMESFTTRPIMPKDFPFTLRLVDFVIL